MDVACARRAGWNGFRIAFVALLSALPLPAQEIIELTGEDRWLEADFRELYRLGTLAGEEWEQFGDLDDVAFDRAGNLHILDTQSNRVFVVGQRRPRLVPGTLGGQGEGPGEFVAAMGMAVMADGRVAVADMSRRVYQVFSPDGEFRRTVPMAGNPDITTVGFVRAQPGADAIIKVPTLARWVRFSGDAFRGPLVLPSSHVVVRTNLAGARAETDTIAKPWLPPIDFESWDEMGLRNRTPTPTLMLSVFSPALHLDVLPDGGLAFSDSSAYAIKITEPGGRLLRVVMRPLHPQPMSRRVIRAEKDRRLTLAEGLAVTRRCFGEHSEPHREPGFCRPDPRRRWTGHLLGRPDLGPSARGESPRRRSHRCARTGRAATWAPIPPERPRYRRRSAQDGLLAFVETDALGVETVIVKRLETR